MSRRFGGWSALLVALSSLALASCTGGSEGRVKLQGGGATFPAPLYQTWFAEYNKLHPQIRVEYQELGSGAGIENFTKGHFFFGASDSAMTDEQIAKVEGGVVLLPMTAGSIVLTYNVPGAPADLKLSRKAYVGIFSGKVAKWNDPAIAEANPGATLPDLNITVVHRADSSGTSFVFTKHLAAIDEGWAKSPGFGTSIEWPAGVGAQKNTGVAAQVKETPGAIGYVEYGFADKGGLLMAALENKAGEFVKPTTASAQASLASAELPADRRIWVSDPEGKGCYPIVTYTWLLANKSYKDPKAAEALKGLIRYGLTEGQKQSEKLGYVPLPESVASAVLSAADEIGK